MRQLARSELSTSSQASRIPAGRLGSPLGSSWYARFWGGLSVPGGRLPGAVLFWHATATRPATTSRERSESRMAFLKAADGPAESTRRAQAYVMGGRAVGNRGRVRCVTWRGRLLSERLLLIVELDVRLVEQGHEKAEREVSGGSFREREAGVPAMQVALQPNEVGAELPGVEIVIGSPGRRPVRRRLK